MLKEGLMKYAEVHGWFAIIPLYALLAQALPVHSSAIPSVSEKYVSTLELTLWAEAPDFWVHPVNGYL